MKIPFSAVLLAGGKSTRMGRDKALIEIEGEPLWQRQLRVLQALEPREIFISGPHRSDACLNISDAKEDAGPLGGMVSSLRHCSTTLLVVLAVDLPEMKSEFLRELLGECSENCGAVPRIAHRFEPLAAVYPKAASQLAERQLQLSEYSLQAFCCACASEGLVRPRPLSEGERSFFQNLNTPGDLIDITARM